MQEKEILAYLEENPEFLQTHATHFGLRPSLERVISLSERQLLEEKDKNRILEKQFNELVENARANEQILQRLQSMTLALLRLKEVDSLASCINHVLADVFELNRSTLYIWHSAARGASSYHVPSADTLEYLNALTAPICTQFVNDEILCWFPDSPVLQSFALLPLHGVQKDIAGIVVIGSSEPNRFRPDRHNHFLQLLSEQISAALIRFLDGQKAEDA